MGNRMHRLAVAALVAALVPSLAPAGGDESLSVEDAVTRQVARVVGRPVAAAFTVRGDSGTWHFLCGRPEETDGRPFDIDRSALASNEFGADFCALVTTRSGAPEIVEFDIGSNDMPAMDWVEKYHLPVGILSGR
jgi:hypothetical protein